MAQTGLGSIKFKIYPQFKKDFFLDIIGAKNYNTYLAALQRVPFAVRLQLKGYIDLEQNFEEMVKLLQADAKQPPAYKGGGSDFDKRCFYIIEFYKNSSDEDYEKHSVSYMKNTFPFLSTIQINNIFNSRGNHDLLKTVLYLYNNIKFGNDYDIYLENKKIEISEEDLSDLDPKWVQKGGNFHFIEEVNVLEEDAWAFWSGKERELERIGDTN